MLRAALKHEQRMGVLTRKSGLDTHNAACGIETIFSTRIPSSCVSLDTHNAACGIETRSATTRTSTFRCVSTHTMLRAALKPVRDRVYEICRWVSTHTMLRAALKHVPTPIELAGRSGLDTHNAACGIETSLQSSLPLASPCLDTHNAACGIETS